MGGPQRSKAADDTGRGHAVFLPHRNILTPGRRALHHRAGRCAGTGTRVFALHLRGRAAIVRARTIAARPRRCNANTRVPVPAHRPARWCSARRPGVRMFRCGRKTAWPRPVSSAAFDLCGPPMPTLDYTHYYRYDELISALKSFATEFPDLVEIQFIGSSFEGRPIPLATITNRATGSADDKPAYWVDGNIHSIELSASSACLYLLEHLTGGYGKDADITRCLDTRAFYVCPRINPDGAEWALADQPKFVRSSTRRYPYDEDPVEGLIVEDIDGDGRILQMRVRDPNGPWKKHPQDARLL